MHYEEFKQGMRTLAEAFDYEMTPEQTAVYWKMLRDRDGDVFAEAIDRVMLTERRFPVIATLIGHCDRVSDERATRQREQAEAAEDRFIGDAEQVTIPACEKCHDLGWYTIPSSQPNKPGRIEKCDCGAAFKGPDHDLGRKQRNAFLFGLDRDHARYPPRVNADPPKDAAEAAERLRMDRLSKHAAAPPSFEPMPRHETYVPIPTTFQSFRIVPAKDEYGRPGFRAAWVLGDRAASGSLGNTDLVGWKRTRDGVRTAMLYRFGDVMEYGEEQRDAENSH